MGHIPPGVYDLPHFDVHFYLEPIEDVFAIEPGTCGPEFVRCDQFDLAKKPIPSNYIHPDYKDVDAVAPGMGNHLIDLTGPEFNGQRFTRSWIFGIYDGRITYLRRDAVAGLHPQQAGQVPPDQDRRRGGARRATTRRFVCQVRHRARHLQRIHGGLRTPGAQRPGAAGTAGPTTAATPNSLILVS